MTKDSIQVFEDERFGQLRIFQDDKGEPWFVASDVCKTLGVNDPGQSCRNFDEDEKGLFSIQTPGGKQMKIAVSEPGFYRLVLKSRKPEAKAFQRWVTHEVLPSIRKSGGYMVATENDTPETIMARAVLIANETIERQKQRIAELEPKALFADAVAASDGTCLVGELAKMFRQNGWNIGQNRLFEVLREDGFLGKSGSNYNVPTQRAMDMGLFRIKETVVVHADGHQHISRTPKVTGRGQRYFMNYYIKHIQNGVR